MIIEDDLRERLRLMNASPEVMDLMMDAADFIDTLELRIFSRDLIIRSQNRIIESIKAVVHT